MKSNKIFSALIAAMVLVPGHAQIKKTPVKKKKAAPVVVVKEPSKFDEMLDNTQQVVFIDSVVVEKQQFLKYYRLTAEAGTIDGYNHFFHSEDQPYSTVYVNQLGNKCWYANSGRLYTSDMLGTQWSEPFPLEGFGHFQRSNYPYMLSDGTTLYFSAIGDEGLGGLDIYVTRYDSETGKFLLSENIGLPFNSEANDYMYVVDEFNGVGYFATDRRQPDGKVCIYTFIPNKKRVTYSSDKYNESVIRSRARIDRIADTWGDGVARQETLDRLGASKKKTAKQQPKKQEFEKFFITDDIVYTSPSDFRDADNQDRLSELNQMRKRFQTLGTELEKARSYYASRPTYEKNNLKEEMLDLERDYYQLETNIRQLEKIIRNAEIKIITP